MKLLIGNKELLNVNSVNNNINVNNEKKKGKSITISIANPKISADEIAAMFSPENYNGSFSAIAGDNDEIKVDYTGYPKVSITSMVNDNSYITNIILEQ